MSSIDFPAWVKITQCERATSSFTTPTAHGIIREQVPVVTDHGRTMVLYRTRFPEPPKEITRRTVVYAAAGRRYRRVPGAVKPGRYRPV